MCLRGVFCSLLTIDFNECVCCSCMKRSMCAYWHSNFLRLRIGSGSALNYNCYLRESCNRCLCTESLATIFKGKYFYMMYVYIEDK